MEKVTAEKIYAMAEVGVTQEIISQHFGVSKSEFFRRMEEEPALRDAYQTGAARAKTKLIDTAFGRATDPTNKNPATLIFMLKARCGFREYEERGKGNAIDQAKLARETLEKIRKPLAKFMPKRAKAKDKGKRKR